MGRVAVWHEFAYRTDYFVFFSDRDSISVALSLEMYSACC